MGADERFVRRTSELISFVDRTDGHGFSVVDHAERRRCTVNTVDPVDPEELPANEFDLPVDRTVSLRTSRLSIPHSVVGYVRHRDGQPIAEITKGDERSFREGCYRIEFTTPIKLYVVVESSFDIRMTEDELTIDLGGEADIVLGVRIHYDRPAATITTTDDPVDLMRAVSAFGSALKTTSCERSYPTLRGHPPAIEYGDAFCLPDVLDPPETGITIEVPPEYGAVYTASSLAYYLGATVRPGDDPVVTTDEGFVHRLDEAPGGFEAGVERTLKRCLLLDCVTRTEGHYPVDLHERSRIEEAVSLDFSELYGRSLATQVEAYLDVPYTVVEPHVPRWKLTAHVDPAPESAEAIPFVARELAAIRTVEPTDEIGTTGATPESLGIDEFVRARESNSPEDQRVDTGATPVVRIDGTDALEDMWIGDGVPVGASKGMIEAFRNHVTRSPSDGDIDITVVVNDPGMIDESREVNEVYGSREELPFDVTVAEQLTTAELAAVLGGETDFLHYIGHIDERGFECSDGRFDAADIEETGVDAFFLNACESYQQGTYLIESGAIAGVTTLTPVSNDEAEAMGKKVARLLNLGFPLYAALDVTSTGQEYNNYTVVGDSSFNIVQSDVGIASCIRIEKTSESYITTYYTYPTNWISIGSMTKPFVGNTREYFLTSGKTGEFRLSEKELDEFTSLGEFPVIHGSEIYWTDYDSRKL
jgi:hypothetical protein